MKTVLRICVVALGLAFATARPSEAASVFICASPVCGSGGSNITFSLNDFDGGFDVNGSQVQVGLNSPASISVSTVGSFVDGAAKNAFSGSYVLKVPVTPISDTFFFLNVHDEITDVLSWSYSQKGTFGALTGFVIEGVLSATDLAALGIEPTPEDAVELGGAVFGFGGFQASISPTFQAWRGAPEPSTWAMMLLGYVGLAFAGHRQAMRVIVQTVFVVSTVALWPMRATLRTKLNGFLRL
jgi:hypothetical protein